MTTEQTYFSEAEAVALGLKAGGDDYAFGLGKVQHPTLKYCFRPKELHALCEAAAKIGAEKAMASPLAQSVITAARLAMNESYEAGNATADIAIPSHLAASLSLCLDEHDAALT